MKDKEQACQYLQNRGYGKLDRILLNGKLRPLYMQYLLETYNMPKDITADILNARIQLTESANISDVILFFLLDAAKNTTTCSFELTDYFTQDEIQEYSKYRYEGKKAFSFPLIISCVEIVPNKQWIGSLPLSVLNGLRDQQIVNYNTQTQRAMTRIQRGTETFYKITVNNNAVKSIKSLLHNREYVPDTLTFNIPESSSADWVYDKEKKQMVFQSLDRLDIIDGFHRYLAISQESFENPDFDVTMEIRITNFSTEEAKQFIWQADQKTHMKKSVVESYDMHKDANIITERINQSPQFLLQGEIQEQRGKIKPSELGTCIAYYYTTTKKKLTNVERLEIQNKIIFQLNFILQSCPELMGREISFKELSIIFWVLQQCDPQQDSVRCQALLKHKLPKANQIRAVLASRGIISKALNRDIERL